MKKYVTKRDEVCGGLLLTGHTIKPTTVVTENGEMSIEEAEKSGLCIPTLSATTPYRGMLIVNWDGFSHDLIWTTPTNYPIRGMSESSSSELVIDHYVELGELLKYMKYGVDLTQKDLYKIYRKLIVNNYWIEHHRELFGWEKSDIIMDSYTYVGDEMISLDTYNKLREISWIKNGKPSEVEPGYKYIHRR